LFYIPKQEKFSEVLKTFDKHRKSINLLSKYKKKHLSPVTKEENFASVPMQIQYLRQTHSRSHRIQTQEGRVG